MDLQNVSGGAIALTKLGKVIANGATATGIEDKWLQDPDIAALVTAGDLVASNFAATAGSEVVQPEVTAALAATHSHANKAELDLLTDGDHDVSDGSAHSIVTSNQTHATGDGSDHADVAANTAAQHTHTNKTELDLVSDGDHDVLTGNPHGATPTDVAYTAGNPADWAVSPPADLQAAIDRLAAQLAIVGAAPIP